jgi:hypothetical protein
VTFQSQLPDDFVFHSVWWQVCDTTEGVRDGEADFVIAHPDFGILLQEDAGLLMYYDNALMRAEAEPVQGRLL